ncbi:MAG: hypothetical protein MUO27_01525 [Sedimentisphaerales bacterium]|nr:hypothetical protein [Sedimentisphaerales bacterium]
MDNLLIVLTLVWEKRRIRPVLSGKKGKPASSAVMGRTVTYAGKMSYDTAKEG